MTAAEQFARYWLRGMIAHYVVRAAMVVALGLMLLLGARCSLDHAVRDARVSGAQEVRDSVAAAAVVALRHRADSLGTAADSAGAELAQAGARLVAAIAAAAQQARDVEPLRFTHSERRIPVTAARDTGSRPAAEAAVDSLRLGDDTTVYGVPHPVAAWMAGAEQTIRRQDAVLLDVRDYIRDSVRVTLARYDTALYALDSVATSERTMRLELQRQLTAERRRRSPRIGRVAAAVLGAGAVILGAVVLR